MILYLSALRILVNQFGSFANPFITIELGLHENVLKLFLISKYILILTFWNIYWYMHVFTGTHTCRQSKHCTVFCCCLWTVNNCLMKNITKLLLKVYNAVGPHYWLSWATCGQWAVTWTCLLYSLTGCGMGTPNGNTSSLQTGSDPIVGLYYNASWRAGEIKSNNASSFWLYLKVGWVTSPK